MTDSSSISARYTYGDIYSMEVINRTLNGYTSHFVLSDPSTQFGIQVSDSILTMEEQKSWLDELGTYTWPERSTIRMFGKDMEIPRESLAFMELPESDGDYEEDPPEEGEVRTLEHMYRFPGSDSCPAIPMSSKMCDLMHRVEDGFGYPRGTLNYCLVNRYVDKNATISPHRDKTSTLATGSPIITLSLGDTREMRFDLHKDGAYSLNYRSIEEAKAGLPRTSYKFSMKSGDAILINDRINTRWTHSIPRTRKEVGVRYSLTFRSVRIQRSMDRYMR